MYPYVDILTKEAFDVMTKNGKDFSFIESNNMAFEIVKVDDITNVLFGHHIIMQAHLIEIFNISEKLDINDIIIADLNVEELDGYKDVTPMLNESLELIEIPYKYRLKLFIPEHINITPKRIEYALIQLPLAFSVAAHLYKQSLFIIEEAVFKPEELVLLKVDKIPNSDVNDKSENKS